MTRILSLWLIFAVIVVLFIGLWWGLPEYEKSKADAMLQGLCARDGRVIVYQKVKLPASSFVNGAVVFPERGALPATKEAVKPSDEFFYDVERTWIVPESGYKPSLWRLDAKLYRASDRKVIGEGVTYGRRGGDPIGPWQQSYRTCPSDTDIVDVIRATFVPD